jgi:deazaflavin-dependent oxidoreductase (nitroreductase family)
MRVVTSRKDLIFKVFTEAHRAVYDLSKGKLGGKVAGMPVLKLTTVGRKSGDRRTTMLTSPLLEDDDVILIASFGGDDRNPAWYLNLVADPDVEIEIDGSKRLMRARVADGAERTRLWDAATAAHENYADYQRKTDREIPVVVLSPR